MNLVVSPSVSDRFVMALEGLHAAVAARFRSGVITVAMIWLVCNRVRRVERRVMRLLALFRAGTLPAERVLAVRTGGVEGRAVGVVSVRLPRRFGWLLPLVPCHAAGFASQLRHTLAEPEMVAFLAASPAARRALMPLCRMLAIEAAVLTPPVAVGSDKVSSVAVAKADDFGGLLAHGVTPPADGSAFREGPRAQGPPLI